MDKSNSSREICIKFKQMISLLYKIINGITATVYGLLLFQTELYTQP